MDYRWYYCGCGNSIICRHLVFDESIIVMKNMIKKLRKEAGLRQEDLASKVGVSRQTIIAIENDKYDPTLELAMKLARQLQTTVEELFILED